MGGGFSNFVSHYVGGNFFIFPWGRGLVALMGVFFDWRKKFANFSNFFHFFLSIFPFCFSVSQNGGGVWGFKVRFRFYIFIFATPFNPPLARDFSLFQGFIVPPPWGHFSGLVGGGLFFVS